MTSVLILAGSRDETCPLCVEANVVSKSLIPLSGARMIDHMLRALRDTPELDGDIWISGLCPDRLRENAPADLIGFLSRVKASPSEVSPADAAMSAVQAGADLPLLITTSDHPLLRPAMIREVLAGAEAEDCDVAVGLAPRSVIAEAYPSTKRTYLNFGGEGYSGCNLFLLRNTDGLKAVEFWRAAGRDRKKPLKLARRLGIGMLARLLFGRLSVSGVFQYGSERVGAKVRPVIIPIAEAAIDVDRPGDLVLVNRIMATAA